MIMAQITNIITIHEYNKMTAEQRAALSGENMLAVVQQDWEEARINAAIAAMQAELSNPNNTFMMCEDKRAIIVRRAVGYADALIAQLQKKGDEDGKSN